MLADTCGASQISAYSAAQREPCMQDENRVFCLRVAARAMANGRGAGESQVRAAACVPAGSGAPAVHRSPPCPRAMDTYVNWCIGTPGGWGWGALGEGAAHGSLTDLARWRAGCQGGQPCLERARHWNAPKTRATCAGIMCAAAARLARPNSVTQTGSLLTQYWPEVTQGDSLTSLLLLAHATWLRIYSPAPHPTRA